MEDERLRKRIISDSSATKRIYVFCDSCQGKKTSYHDATIDLSREFVYMYDELYIYSLRPKEKESLRKSYWSNFLNFN